MADFVKLDEQHWLGASTDDKPDPTTIDVGAEALEYDTGDRYIADGTTWRGPVTQASVTADTSSLNALVGALASSAVTDPAALSATLLELARGQLSFLAELGTSADAKVTSDAAGTIAAYLRGVTYTLNTLLPAALGQGTQAQGLRIAIPSDMPTLVTSIDGTPTVAVSSEPALAPATDGAVAYGATGTVYFDNGSGFTALTVKQAKISCSSAGANTVVAAVSSKKLRVLAWDLKVNAAVNAKWQSHVTPTDLTGLYYCGAQGDGIARTAGDGTFLFETVAGEALDINLSGAVAVGGSVTYVER